MTNHMQVCSPLRLLNEAQIASKAALEKLSVLYSSIVDHLEVGLRRIHDAQDDLPTPEDIEREVSRSRHLLGGFDGKIDQSLAEAKYIADLEVLCNRLEQDPGAIAKTEVLDDRGLSIFGIQQHVESGWMTDQYALFTAKERVFNEICSTYSYSEL